MNITVFSSVAIANLAIVNEYNVYSYEFATVSSLIADLEGE